MASNQLPFIECAFINTPSLFCGDNYPFWKVRMKIFMESVYRSIWQAVITEYKTPTKTKNGKEIEKPFDSWDQNEIKRVENDAKALNIIHSALNSNEFFRILACTTTKEAWDLLQVTHEGTPEVRHAKKNTLIHEYETLRMTQREIIMDMQKRFTHIINHLKGVGKIFDKEEVNVKVLKSLNRRWQSTMNAITESKNLTQMISVVLFGKLREYEMDMTKMAEEKQKDKRVKGLALKLENSSTEKEESSDEDKFEQEEMNIMIRKFSKFTWFECGKVGHIKANCPNLEKQGHEEKKPKFRLKKKKAYIAWEENESTSSSEMDSGEKADLCLMADHEVDYEVSDSDSSIYSYDQLHDSFCDLYKEAMKLSSLNRKLKGNIKEMELKISLLEKDIHFLNSKNEKLKLACLECKNLYAILKNKNEASKVKSKSTTSHISCNYCMKLGHSFYKCMIRKIGVPSGKFVWTKKLNCDYTNIAKQIMWYLDSGCSRHMTGDKNKFVSLQERESGTMTYGDNNKGKTLGSGTVSNFSNTLIEDVLYVEGLKYNLRSISQLCDKNFNVFFNNECCLVCDKSTNETLFVGKRINNIYILELDSNASNITCPSSNDDLSWLWHRCIPHINVDQLNGVASKYLVEGLPKIKFLKEGLCDACQKGKQFRTSFKNKKIISTSRLLKLLHMDLFGPSGTTSLGGKIYGLVIIDDFSRFTWAAFLSHKDSVFKTFKIIAKKIQNEKTPYEFYKDRKPNISHFKVFGCKCFILNNGKETLGKFDAKADEGVFIGYSTTSKAYRIFNKRSLVVEESIHVKFDESNPLKKGSFLNDEDEIGSSNTQQKEQSKEQQH
uniref:Retrovirus-related Pol polyprotein from transposon TNT 1-94 n=1 Tax=Cajanus cajan TaxID=3821 RepID=A0A151RBA3_CAJCA|nr:Retrovirus-related Pol polyprotein from transposon TNT 1-94 [Cajanus cajan]